MSLPRRSMTGLIVAVALGAAAGCSGQTVNDGRPQVVAGVYPLAFVADRVAGDLANVESLAAPGVEPHDLELGVGQVAAVTAADLVLRAPALQPALDAAVRENEAGDLDATSVPPSDGVDFRADDPHFWLEPLLLADVGDAVAARLSETDPAHEADYLGGAEALRKELEALSDEYAARLGDCDRSTVVVGHDAFGYLERYGLVFEPVAGLSPEAEPTAADLARLQELIADEQITTVFSEPLAGDRLTGTLAEDAGVQTAVLDPLESQPAEGDYLTAMRANLAALTDANGCG